MSIERCVSHFIATDLSGDEIFKLIGKEVVLYSDLKNYKTIQQLLGKEGYVVILYQTSSRTQGHFVAITKNSAGKVRYCDSYAIKTPDAEVQYTPYDKKLPPYLTDLLKGVDYESNSVDYQSTSPTVSTCGRYASLFCLFRNLSLNQIHELYKGNGSAYLRNTDNLVVLLTLVGLRDIRNYLVDVPRSGIQ